MVLQFVGEYVVAFLVESLSDRTGFLVFKRYDVFALRARFVAFLVEPQLFYAGVLFFIGATLSGKALKSSPFLVDTSASELTK